jgi:NADH-quinone oxidoreductase subunit N
MENIRYDLITALPEIILLGMAMLVLIADLFLKQSNRIAIYALSQMALLVAAYFTFTTYNPGVGYAFTGAFVDDTM